MQTSQIDIAAFGPEHLEAAVKLPQNPSVAFNAALAVLRCLEHQGWEERLGQQVPALIGKVRQLDPGNGKLPALAALHQQVLKKYNKSAPRSAAPRPAGVTPALAVPVFGAVQKAG